MSTTASDALAERLFNAALQYGDVYLVYIGDRLGLYQALADRGPSTAAQLAATTATNPRYVREWLESQAVGGIVDVAEGADADARRYSLSDAHADVLLNRDSGNYMSAFLRMMVGMARPVGSVLDAFRTGGGVPYSDYDADFVEGQGDGNRVQFVNLLGQEWLPAIPDVDSRLRDDPPARVADVACGVGWSSIAIARAYPKARVDGSDLDEDSIRLARENLAASDVGDRVRFERRDAAELDAGEYDLVTVFEAVHDMSRPVEVLASLRRLLAPGGSVLIADERTAEEFHAPGDELERMFYVWSVLHCLPVGMAEQPSVGTGTLMRPQILRDYAERAGFSNVEVLPIENDFWRFYRLTP